MGGFSGFGAVPDSAGGDSVTYRADQIEYDFDDEVIILTGRARIDYQLMALEAHHIEFEVRNNLVRAEGLVNPDNPDSIVGLPRFASGAESFTGTRLTYNIETRQGIVEDADSESPEGFYYGRVVKRTGEEQLDVADGVYTTCDHEHPHYAFCSSKMRVLAGDKVIAEPVVVEVAEVPIMWFPYGVFFIDQDRRSGFLSPTMGENAFDGRYMDGLGYYIAPNDYFGFQGVFSIAERQNYQWRLTSEYAWRYRMKGSVAYQYDRNWGVNPGTVWLLNAAHSQELTPRSNVRGRVSFTSSEEPRGTTNATQAQIINQTLTSTLGYTARTIDGRSVRADANVTKNLQSGSITAKLPSLSVSSGQRYVFQQPGQRGPRATEPAEEPDWWRKLGYNWSWSGQNNYYRGPSDKDIFDTWLLEEAVGDTSVIYRLVLTKQSNTGQDGTYSLSREYRSGGIDHLADGIVRELSTAGDSLWLFTGTRFDSTLAYIDASAGRDRLRATIPGYVEELQWVRAANTGKNTQTAVQRVGLSLPLPTPRWLNITPNASWSANWYSEPQRSLAGDSVITTKHNFSAGISSSMNAYGTYPVNRGPIVAFRHVVTPSFSASYNLRRDMRNTDYIFGGTEVDGDTSRVLTFGLGNILQMKALSNGEEVKFDRLLSLQTGISFNVDADGRRWSDPTTTIGLNPSRYFDVRVSTTHTFYKTDSLGNDIGFDWFDPTLRAMTVNSSLSFAGGGRSGSRPGEEGFVGQDEDIRDRRGLELTPEERERLAAENTGSRWSPGWNLNLRHSYAWRRPAPTSTLNQATTNTLDISADVAPFEDWQVGYTTQYNFVTKERQGDEMNIVRRLHCWEASLNWIMKGPRRGYYFQIYVIGLPDVKIQAKSDSGRGF